MNLKNMLSGKGIRQRNLVVPLGRTTWWQCPECLNRVVERWEGARLAFACTNRKGCLHQRYITTSLVWRKRDDLLLWVIPVAEIVALLDILLHL